MKRIIVAALLLTLPHQLWAACSNCGTSTPSCASGSTVAQVQSCVDAAPDEAVITFANGTYNWADTVTLSGMDGFTLKCATPLACTINFTGTVFYIDSSSAPSSNLRRVNGFNFVGQADWIFMWAAQHDFTNIRIDNNVFEQTGNYGSCPGGITVGAADDSVPGHIYGVIDNNTFIGAESWKGVSNGSGTGTFVDGKQGTANNLFIENNIFSFDSEVNNGCAAYDGDTSGTVIRYNNFIRHGVGSHGVCHTGPSNFEIYNNIITVNQAIGWSIMHQGTGEIIAFNNNVTQGDTRGIVVNHYRGHENPADGSCNASRYGTGEDSRCDGDHGLDGNRPPTGTYKGYPCDRQPGRNGAGTMRPMYAWGNLSNGSLTGISPPDDYNVPFHLVSNRDYYNSVSVNAQTSPTSPFNGTTGMGFGTLANRPTTCTTVDSSTPNEADAGHGGVGYFATDQGARGKLYVCTSTNTWTEYYEPYTCPHPSTGLTGGCSTTVAGITGYNIEGGSPPADAPVLSSPVDNAVAGWPVVFTWEVYSGAVLYHIQADDDDAFGSPAIDDDEVDPDAACDESSCTYTVQYGGALAANTHYFWRVRALR